MQWQSSSVLIGLACLVLFVSGVAADGVNLENVENCKTMEVDFIVNEGDATAKAIEDDIVSDLAKVGIKVNTRLLSKDDLNEAMVNGDFNLAFSESWGAPYDPQAFAASWSTPDEAYHAALDGLEGPYTKEALSGMIQEALVKETEGEREEAWTEILEALHSQATELPFSGKRIPAVINKRLTGYIPGTQQFDYPAHTLRVLTGSKTVTVAPGAQTGLFSNETGVGRLDPHTYRPNEFFANNWVYDGLVEYGPSGTLIPALAESWTVADGDGEGQTYTFNLRKGVKFHDGAPWNCAAAKLNFDHVLAAPLVTADYHGWYALPGQIKDWKCIDDYTFVVETKGKYYPLLQELSFIRPLRMLSPNLFVGGLDSDPLTENSCHVGWGNVSDSGVTVQCAGIVGGGVSNGGTVSGTGRWIYDKTEMDGSAVKRVHFKINPDHWDAPSGQHPEELVVVHYPTHTEVKDALLDGSLDAVMGSGVLTEAEVAMLKSDHSDKLSVSLTEPIQNRIIVMNTAKAPTDSLQNRKVIIHSIDKASIIKKELAGLDEPAVSLFPKNAPYSGAHLTPLPDYDIEKARLLNCPV
ncbi:hypothetical protein HOP50_11g63010 [Chloropicon primus]|uniref:Solute-binding protein family 5 domain-containing protein n=1 Tax=Chloropicon primus TaxID=1764295 RepID=A0A5B8MTP6_9CHLO|nr:hypothetical protein A3770_11p62790 [Chloropicon primus]UPR02974.1 hypothetical protein HOP50_11g63010 [Chloropicon primus]|mmetsp:Transcript_8194/g.23403  ORF Transcript_8194/g.23403 Transcript_8194/m.23403 type:complete len:580 (-) Transcript_8194:55-1794(-)|eukprot:QDZ23761.1 hypothetical protein A3770_11p62790 [Chloropicon primus]